MHFVATLLLVLHLPGLTFGQSVCAKLFSTDNTLFTSGTHVVEQTNNPLKIREAKEIMELNWLTERYGLENLSYLTKDYIDKGNHLYIIAENKRSGTIDCVLRLIPNLDLSRFDNIEPESATKWNNPQQLVTAGIYYHPNVPRSQEPIFLQNMLTALVDLGKQLDIRGIYAEIITTNGEKFQSLGFKPIGSSFELPGWSGNRFVPMLLDLKEIETNYDNRDFASAWQSKYGVPFVSSFWKRVFKKANQLRN